MKVDVEDNVCCGCAGGIWIMDRGKKLGRIVHAPRRRHATWIMPAAGKTYSMERESDEAEQLDVSSEASKRRKNQAAVDRGGVTREPADI